MTYGVRPQIVRGFDPFGEGKAAASQPVALRPGFLPPPAGLIECEACSARQDAMRVVPGFGPSTAPIVFLGQNPGEDEDLQGEPFVGLVGEEFNRWLAVLGLDREKVYVTNVVKCHTQANRVPRTTEIATCSNLWLPQEFEALPAAQVLIPLGKPAIIRVLGKSAPPLTPITIYHFRIRLLGREMSVFPLPHPAFLFRAQHFGPTFRDVLLPQVRETLQQQLQVVYDACRRH